MTETGLEFLANFDLDHDHPIEGEGRHIILELTGIDGHYKGEWEAENDKRS